MRGDLLNRAVELSPWLVELRRDFHRHPELAFQEFRTSAKVAEVLKSLDVPFETGIAETGVVARLGGAGPSVALRADMDALPLTECEGREYRSTVEGVMHGCGHDAHTAILLGVARLLSGMELPGPIVLIFQPAEEVAGGGAAVVRSGVLERNEVKAVFGLHVTVPLEVGTIGVNRERCCASVDNFRAVIRGKKAHGAYPHLGRDAVVMAGQALVQLQSLVSREIDPLEGAVVTVGSVHGGTAPNIIADEVVMEGTVRSYLPEQRGYLTDRVKEITTSVASAGGGSAEVAVRRGSPAVVNDPAMAEMVLSVGRDFLGFESASFLDRPTMGGEDFSYLSEAVPGAFFRLGSGNEERGIVHPAHTSDFDVDEGCLPVGAAMMAELALRWHEEGRSRG